MFVLYDFGIMSVFPELVHIIVKGPAEARPRTWDFLAVVKIHWWPSSVFCTLVRLLSL